MKKLSKTLAAISALALIMSAGMFVSCSDSDDSDNTTTQTPTGDSQNQGGETGDDQQNQAGDTTGDSSTTTPTGDSTDGNGGSVEQTVTFPLSITPTTEGSTPAYPTDADTSSITQYSFTSPVAYTVATKKKFDTGKYLTSSTDTEGTTANRWNLGGALKTSSGSYNCYMKFDSAPSTKMTVKFFNTNADRTVTVVSGTTATAGTVKTTVNNKVGVLCSETFTVTKGSEVYLGATASGIWVSEIIWEE